MPSLLNLLRGRKTRPPTSDAATSATSVAFVARRRQRSPLRLAAAASCRNASDTNDYNIDDDDNDESTSTATATAASASAASCWSSTSRDDGKSLRSSDISVSIVVKDAAPKARGLFRRFASLMRTQSNTAAAATGRGVKGPGAEDNDNNGRAESKAEASGKGGNGVGQKQREADEEEPSVAKPPPAFTCRRRRLPIRLRDVFCWPYAVDETDEAAVSSAAATSTAGRGDVGRRTALAPSELECLYSVRQLQSIVLGAPDCQPQQAAPVEETGVPLGAGKADAKLVRRTVSLCIDSDRSSSSSSLGQPQEQQKQRGDTADRLGPADVMVEAESKDGGVEAGIGRPRVGSAEQRRVRLRRSPGASTLDQCQQGGQPEASLRDTCHRVSDKVSVPSSLVSVPVVAAEAALEEAVAASPSAAADSSLASAGAGANSLSTQNQQHHHHQQQQQQVFADLCLVRNVANSLTAVTHTTEASSSPTCSSVSAADSLTEHGDCSTG